ncbi:lipase/acyltransferase domain-containing protein [Nannocystaceae bacterium ST9]
MSEATSEANAGEPGEPISSEAVCRVDDNTLDTGKIPIVFVPGVMGSRLHFPEIGQSWDPDSTWAMIHWVRISAERTRQEFTLTNPAEVMTENDDLTAAQRERGWAGVAWGFYGQFVQDLQRQRFGRYQTPVYVIGYDWRQNNRTSGDAVARRIEQILAREGVERFILISHSMGGLVTRACLKNNAGVAGKAIGVVHIAQPVHGAAVLVRRMFTGAVSSVDGGVGLAMVLGNNRKKFQTIMSALPGPMQLLVTNHYRDTDGSGWYDYASFEHPATTQRWEGDVWSLYASPQSPPGLLAPAGQPYSLDPVPRREFARRLAEARDYHAWVDVWKHEQTWSIYSTGLVADMRVHFELPAAHYDMHVMPSFDMAPPVILYSAKRADGTEVTVGDPNPENRGNVMRRRPQSDSTVPTPSGEGLFPGQQHAVKIGSDYDALRQFRISGAAHDAICHDGNCERCLFDILRHVLGV